MASEAASFDLKVPKGTRDIDPFQSCVREQVVGKLVEVFKRHGGVTIETPVFELKATLTGKYGEDSKLIYDLADQGGESCALRYDLTVPFARFVAMNKIHSMKRYQIAKVYRRDNPAMTKGKYREFYQCDFDIAGPTEPMLAEAECVKMMSEILSSLDVGQFVIKINHRRLLDGIFAACNVPADKFRAICSAVDKLDKVSWDEVRKEMIEAKGLDAAAADKIWTFVQHKGNPTEVAAFLKSSGAFENEDVKYVLGVVEEMELLFNYLVSYGVQPPVVSFDLSLARGLDYYTGIIYEVVLIGEGQELGSVAGGGRYDNLVGMFSKSGTAVPCVGFSVGIERLFGILEKNAREKQNLKPSPTDVMVVSMGSNLVSHRLALVNELWNAGIRAEQLYQANPKPRNQLDYANENGIRFAVIIGDGELAENTCSIKDLDLKEQTKIPRAELISYLKKQLGGATAAAPASAPAAAPAKTTAPAPAAKPAAKPAEGGAAAPAPAAGEKAKKPKGKKGDESTAAVARPEFIDHRIKIFETIFAEQQADYAKKAADKVPIEVKLPDGSVKTGIAYETTPMNIAFGISPSLAKRSVICKVDGNIWDLTRPLEANCQLEICDFTTKEGRDTFWHSTAHMMGEALELQYGCHLCIGPCNGIDQGFFYDSFMGEKVITNTDYKIIETGVAKVASSKQPYQRIVITKEQALEIFKFNKFKCELINKFAEAGTVMTCYRCGDLVDLCRGPHIPNTEMVKAMMVTHHGQAYWLGDRKGAELQRVYGVSFPDKKQLDEHRHFLEEAKKRDHRLLGIKQDLFFFDQLSPGSCFFLPMGARVYNALQDLMRSEYRIRGFQEVISPNMFNMKLWETSGHAAKYREDMFLLDVEGQEFGLKPMNCPGHCIMFKHRARSWRELPLRMADFGALHRNEASGALTGLTRVRRFQQDDAHIFCMPDQVKAEMSAALDFMQHIYTIFGFEFTLELSTRPENFLGDISVWDVAEKNLEDALNESGLPWSLNPGDGAFYGPKIDIKVKDALRRKHQCATIQLDFQLPIRFELEYMGDNDTETASKLHRPVMIHRAILGSVERMISVLSEHYGGKWPFWLSPRQVMFVPVAAVHNAYAQSLARTLTLAGFFAEADVTTKSLPKKVREAQLQQWNYILVCGDAEVEGNTVTVRSRQESEADQDVDKGTWPVQDFMEAIDTLRKTRSSGILPSRSVKKPAASAADAPAASEESS